VPDQGPSRIHVTRRIAADPTSTALLLAGPTALDLWPGVRRVADTGHEVLVEAEIGPPAAGMPRTVTMAWVRARPPQRTPTSFVVRFEWTGQGLPGTAGELTLTYAPGDGAPATRADLVLDRDGLVPSRLSTPALTGMAEKFLANVALAAESRSRAA